MTIQELYKQYPNYPIPTHYLNTLDTPTLTAIFESAKNEILHFNPFSSFFNLKYENYCTNVYKYLKKYLKQRQKEEKRKR